MTTTITAITLIEDDQWDRSSLDPATTDEDISEAQDRYLDILEATIRSEYPDAEIDARWMTNCERSQAGGRSYRLAVESGGDEERQHAAEQQVEDDLQYTRSDAWERCWG